MPDMKRLFVLLLAVFWCGEAAAQDSDRSRLLLSKLSSASVNCFVYFAMVMRCLKPGDAATTQYKAQYQSSLDRAMSFAARGSVAKTATTARIDIAFESMTREVGNDCAKTSV